MRQRQSSRQETRSGGLSEETMQKIMHRVRRFMVREDGPTAVEYAVMLALIILVCIAAIRLVGNNTATSFSNSASSIAS